MHFSRELLFQHRLTTAEILYHLPDYPDLLQTFVWQTLDTAPRFPRLKSFLDYWVDHIEGKLHSVRICDGRLLGPETYRYKDFEIRIH